MWTRLIILSLIATTIALPRTRFNTCESLLNCNGHGTCSDTNEGVFCFCESDWIGVRCQIPMDKWLNGSLGESCEKMIDCNDHGTCSNSAEEGLQCNCFPGWFGVRCQIPVEQ